MGQETLMIIVFGIMLLAVGIFFLVTRKGSSAKNTNISTQNTEDANVVKGVKRQEKTVEQMDMSGFIKFDKIANDMIYQNNGERYSMVIQCKGINYNLMSEIEQMAVEEGFIMFLNTLKFPVQLYVQTRSIDLNENVKKYKERVKEFSNKQSEVTARYNELEDDVDATQEEINEAKREKIKYTNIAEYVADITRYVERMALNKYMLQRNFYIVISYNKSELATTEKFTKEEYEDMCYRELYTRAQGIIGSLSACSVNCSVLNSNELAQLVYVSFNKDDANTLNIKDALESGVFRLYTSSDDVMKRRREMIEDELNKRSQERVEQAVREAIEKGILVSEEERNEEIEKEIDRRALKMIDKSSVEDKLKQELKNSIKGKRKQRLEAIKGKETENNVANASEDEMIVNNTSNEESVLVNAEDEKEELITSEQKKGDMGDEEE